MPPSTTHRLRAAGPIAALLRAGVALVHDLRVALGLVLILGAAVALLGTVAFAELAEEVRRGTTQRFDEAVLRQLDALDAPWIDAVMLEATALGDGIVVLALATVAATFLWLTRHRYSAGLLVSATIGGLLMNVILKAYFDRPRPQVVAWGTHVSTSSFPSGHATSAIVVYATVAYLVTRLQRRRWARVTTTLVAATVILLIAASRLFLGVHYPSDVAAGLVVGLAWAAFCVAVLEALHRFIRREAPEEAVHEDPTPDDPSDAPAASSAVAPPTPQSGTAGGAAGGAAGGRRTGGDGRWR